jgi:hypothetical protein
MGDRKEKMGIRMNGYLREHHQIGSMRLLHE